jgi:molybdenum cofactor biosynthesis enzyme MoaA
MITIPIENQLSYKSIARNKDLKLEIKNHCNFPNRVLVVDIRGHCFLCTCEAWLPISVGQIQDFDALEKIWSSSTARELQQDIAEKKFSHCAVDRCGVLTKDQRIVDYSDPIHQKHPEDLYYVSVNIDDSCNLICPSCRSDQIMITQGSDYQQRLQQVNHLMQLLQEFDHPCQITMTGNGDPLASAIMRPLIHNFRPRHNHTIRLFTNGLLLKKQLSQATVINNISQYFISIDAGSACVYEQVRRPGRWNVLIKNLDFLQQLIKSTKATVLLMFVLQASNHNDMQNFVDLCQHYGFSGIINRLEDWGTWKDFEKHDVIGNQAHPLHSSTLQYLRNLYQTRPINIIFNPSLESLCQ